MAYDWWLTPVVYAGVSLVLLEARLARAAARGRTLVFRGALLLKLLFGFGASIVSYYLYRRWAETEWWISLLAIGFVLCTLLFWPKTIITDERGIQCLWWWRRRVFIPWDQVEYAETGTVGAIEIVGTHARITFEGYNADPARFRKELTTRSNVKNILTPSEFTGLHL